MKIYVKEAQIKSTAIEVKVVKVGGKQMTLATFRQLEKLDDLLDDDIVWGHVNYHGKDCSKFDHYHLVVQREDEIFSYTYEEPKCLRFDDWTYSLNLEDDLSDEEKIIIALLHNFFEYGSFEYHGENGVGRDFQVIVYITHSFSESLLLTDSGRLNDKSRKLIESLVHRNYFEGFGEKYNFEESDKRTLHWYLGKDKVLAKELYEKGYESVKRTFTGLLERQVQKNLKEVNEWEKIKQCQHLFIAV